MRGVFAVILATVLGLAGCASLPTNSEPHALREFEASANEEQPAGPEPGQEPDLLLRSFYAASAHPSSNYAAARAYLTDPAAQRWDPATETLIVDRLDVTTQQGATAQEVTFDISGAVIGSLRSAGSYVPENGQYEATVTMRRVDGEWRIDALPTGLVLERTELRNQYEPHSLFFFEPTQNVLVSDRRWVYAGEEQLDSVLLTLLADGPSSGLAPAVVPALPADAQFTGRSDGQYRFTGLHELDVEDRELLAAQLTWTLAQANIPAPYEFLADGEPLLPHNTQVGPDDFAEFNPRAVHSTVAPTYALNGGQLYEVAGNSATPAEGPVGEVDDIESADLTAAGTAALVQTSADESRLLITEGEALTEVLTARTISRPSFEYIPNAAWVVLDGSTVVRVLRSETTNEISRSEIGAAELAEINGSISVLRLSQTGARVALIIDGRVYTAVIARSGPAERDIVNVREVGQDLAGTALSLDWHPDGSLLVGTSSPETPVWRVEQDGSSASALPSGNVTAPVVAVSSSSTTMYATDARAALQLPIGGGDNSIWREVPGLQGVRAAVIVGH